MIDPACFPDGRCLEEVDHVATHFVIEENGRLLGAIRYTQYDNIHATHHGDYYREAGIDFEGPVAIPERSVVHPDVDGKGLLRVLADAVVNHRVEQNIEYSISECSPSAASYMRKQGCKSFGLAPVDPRFPGVQFEWILSDFSLKGKHLTDSEND
jgi:hypothetical protein